MITLRHLFVCSVVFLAPALFAVEQPIQELAREQFAFAAKQYAGILKQMESDATRLPRTVVDGKLKAVGPTDWTSGFFPGSLWLIYEQTKDPALLAAAQDYTKRVESIQHFTKHHDLGFMLGCSYGEGWRITGEPAYRDVLIQGARSLSTRYSPKTGVIRSWDSKPWIYPVIIDNMMNLGLLWFAHVETKEPAFREIVFSHADKTLANHYRADHSSYHLLDYDPTTGAVTQRKTVQGYADDSTWARGQAWGLAGYAAAARFTKNSAYLNQAKTIADFLRNHPNLPADGIPYWDFNAPNIPHAIRDAAAGAVMAMGLWDLALQLGPEAGAPYRALAEKQIRSLASPAYRAALNENGNWILMHSVGHFSAKSEIDVPLNYTDYYFLKTLSLVLGDKPAVNGVP
ncbi:glycoside hydrolase family 88 protein [Oleiharenicola lentus]|uniref:glycoside hydrolase family 88 protein n=1 Tax=Oleiharenicola lentus TaxID=2508720 RepID=UPI003F67CE63